jgi:hypothetical protein
MFYVLLITISDSNSFFLFVSLSFVMFNMNWLTSVGSIGGIICVTID